jgi:penicillin V acylase-like amidase (Ntn superfamily)
MRINPFTILIIIFATWSQVQPCTVFYATDGTTALGGNNEDWSDSNTKMWFYPAQDGKYGWVKFGFAAGFPQGGMNDQGLFWDATGCAFLEMPVSEATKEKYAGPLMQKVIEECATVKEALVIFQNYYCEDLYRAQYLIGDATGASMIVEGDSIIINSGKYQVAANFYHSHPELGGYPSRRYEIALAMLASSNQISIPLFGSILAATHQEGNYPTQYSNIYDLKNKVIYLFHLHNFEEYVTIDLNQELQKESHSQYLCDLFSDIHLLSPKSGQAVNPATVSFQWEGKHSSSYTLYCSVDSDFTDVKTVTVVPGRSSTPNENYIPAFLITAIFIGGLSITKRRRFLASFKIVLLFLLPLACNSDISAPLNDELNQISRTLENLQADTTYYWKVVSYAERGAHFFSESTVQTFRTTE